MPIVNYQCDNCNNLYICKWTDLLNKFSEDAKRPIGVTIEVKHCKEFKEVK